MLGKNLSEAMTDIGDDKIQAAMHVYEKKQRTRNLWIRAAAMAAALAIVLTAAFWPGTDSATGEPITAPGVLRVYAYSETENGEQKNVLTSVLEDMTYEPNLWFIGMNRLLAGLPFSMEIPDGYFGERDITFSVTVNYGVFSKKDAQGHGYVKLGDQIQVKNGERIYWSCNEDEQMQLYEKQDRIYADISVYADSTLAGCGVIEIGYTTEGFYFPLRCDTACFPPVEEQLQEISADYVGTQMKAMREKKAYVNLDEKIREMNDFWENYFKNDPEYQEFVNRE